MKRIITLFCVLLTISVSAQFSSRAPWMEVFNDVNRTTAPTFEEIVDAFDTYWADKDETVKGSGYKPFKRWQSLYQSYLNEDGTVMTREQLWDIWRAMSQNRATQVDDSDWQSVGPLNHTINGSWSAGQGRVNTMIVDPNNANTYYVGSPAGGIWVSKDTGSTWSPLSDFLPQIGVSGIAIDPNDSDIIYIATGDDDAGDSYSVGVMKSVDGGMTWNQTGLNENNSPSSMSEIYIDPFDSQRLWVSTNQGVFRTLNGGTNWENVRSGNFTDLKLQPGDSNTIYAATGNRVYRTLDGGDTWTIITNGVLSGTARLVIDVTPANPEVLYIFTTDGSYGAGKIYKSTDSGMNFTLTYNGAPNIFESSQAWFDMAFAVSDLDENEIYTGILNVWKSSDGGSNFTKLNNWNDPTAAAYTHADIHSLRFFNGTLFCGSDGGFYSSTDGGINFADHTEGLAIGQFYRIDVAKQTSELIAGGLQDNGGYSRSGDQWKNYYGADGMEAAFDPADENKVYGFIQSGGGPYFSFDGGNSLQGAFTAPTSGNWITPLEYASNGKLYAAYDQLWELDFCSGSWIQKSTGSFGGGNIDVLETDPNDANIIYVANQNRLYRSTNEGSDFSFVQNFSSAIASIEVNEEDTNTLYIVTSGTTGQIFRGAVSGSTINFENITGSLPNIPKLIIKHQGLQDGDPLYLGTALGVWRYDDILGDWEEFSNNLPNTAVRDLDINEKDGVITAGTYGRGIWQSDITAPAITTDAAITQLATVGNQSISCNELTTEVTVRNESSSMLTAATITYGAGGLSGTIEWTGSLAQGEEEVLALPALGLSPGYYQFTTTIIASGDQVSYNNERSIGLAINAAGVENETNAFETDEDELLILTDAIGTQFCDDGNAVWQRGVPGGALLNQAASGTSVYATNLTGDHPSNIKEYLTTGCYDISSITSPELSFMMAFELEEDWDILYVEYSVNDGTSWEILGTAADNNWYNSDTVPGSNCLNCPGKQWTGTEATLTEYSYDLSSFSSETNMMFRFVFHSDQSVVEEGVVIDDLRIGDGTLSVEQAEIAGFSVYPNPSNGTFNVTWPTGDSLSLEVYDILGKSIINQQTSQGERTHTLELSNLASGLYLLKVTDGSRQITKKIILN